MKWIVDFVNLGHKKSKEWKSAKYRTLDRGRLEDGRPCWDQLRIAEKVKSKREKKSGT
jgi:hypothetical protein